LDAAVVAHQAGRIAHARASAGPGAVLVAEGGDRGEAPEVRPGVRGFALLWPGPDGIPTRAELGVSHRPDPTVGHVLYCGAALTGANAARWRSVWRACTELAVTLFDPAQPPQVQAEERSHLADCPAASTVAVTAQLPGQPLPDTLVAISDAADTWATADRVGRLEVTLANAALETSRLHVRPLAAGQGAVQIRLRAEAGDVLSGTYRPQPGEPLSARVDLVGPDGERVPLQDAEGDVKVIARTPDRVCGAFSVSDRRGWTAAGTFTARLRLGPP
jgi:hypothetical protein